MISLVTGATGFLGSHLVDELLLAGEHVRILVRPESIRKASRRPNLDIVEGRLEDASSVKRAVEGVSRIYHCAAHVADHGADHPPGAAPAPPRPPADRRARREPYGRPSGDGDQATFAASEVASSIATSSRRAARPRPDQAVPSTVARNTAASPNAV